MFIVHARTRTLQHTHARVYNEHMNDAHANDEGKIMNANEKFTAKGVEGTQQTMTLRAIIEEMRGYVIEEKEARRDFTAVNANDEAEAVLFAGIAIVVAQKYGEWCDYVTRNGDGTYTCMLVHTQEEVTISFKR